MKRGRIPPAGAGAHSRCAERARMIADGSGIERCVRTSYDVLRTHGTVAREARGGSTRTPRRPLRTIALGSGLAVPLLRAVGGRAARRLIGAGRPALAGRALDL